MVEPAVERSSQATFIPWLDLGLTLAIGGVWWIAYALLLPRYAAAWSPPREEASHG
jgi:hypothetical protein